MITTNNTSTRGLLAMPGPPDPRSSVARGVAVGEGDTVLDDGPTSLP